MTKEQRPAERPFFSCTFSRRMDVEVLNVEDGRTSDAKTCYHFKCCWFAVMVVRTISSLLQTGHGGRSFTSSSAPPPIPQSICFGGCHPLIKSLSFHFYFTSCSIIYSSIYPQLWPACMVARSGWTISF